MLLHFLPSIMQLPMKEEMANIPISSTRGDAALWSKESCSPHWKHHIENCDGCVKPSVTVVTQIWSTKRKRKNKNKKNGFPHLQQEKDLKKITTKVLFYRLFR